MTTEPLTDVQKARADLAEAIAAIEYKLNIPAQVKRGTKRVGERVKAIRTEKPLVFAGAAAATAAAVGGAVWMVVRGIKK